VLCKIFSYDFSKIRNLPKIFLRSFENVGPGMAVALDCSVNRCLLQSCSSCCSSWVLSRAQCAGALSCDTLNCWKLELYQVLKLQVQVLRSCTRVLQLYWKHLLRQQDVAVITGRLPHPRVDNYNSVIAALIKSAICDKICHFYTVSQKRPNFETV